MPDVSDLVFAFVVFVVGAVLDYYVLWPYLLRRLSAGDAGVRTRVYGIIMAWEWLALIFVAVRWSLLARPWSALWFTLPRGWRILPGALAVLAVAALRLLQTRALTRLSADKRAAVVRRSEHLFTLVPRTATEYRWFVCLSVTAGICEELLYRGFLVWALQYWVGLGGAAAVSAIAFAAAHAYQGKHVVRPAVVGALLQGLALLTQSVVPGIVVHAMLDMMSGASGYLLLQESATPGRPAGSQARLRLET